MDKPLDFSRVDHVVTELKELASKAFQQGQSMDKTELSIFQKLMALGRTLTANTLRRHREDQEVLIMHDGQRSRSSSPMAK